MDGLDFNGARSQRLYYSAPAGTGFSGIEAYIFHSQEVVMPRKKREMKKEEKSAKSMGWKNANHYDNKR